MLQRALSSCQDVAKYINDAKKDHETLVLARELERSLKDYSPESPGFVPLVGSSSQCHRKREPDTALNMLHWESPTLFTSQATYGTCYIDGDMKLKMLSSVKGKPEQR